MFTPDDRARVLAELLATAEADLRVTAAAAVGSAAAGAEDVWSDIDLALRLTAGVAPAEAVGSWTTAMYPAHGAVHHPDVWHGSTLYRVFLLASTLQVDLSLWPDGDFRATGPAFRLIFGEANPPAELITPSVEQLAGMAWLYALHVRSALARGRRWQAVHMLDGLRDHVIGLTCLRFGLPTHQGRGVDQLPAEITLALAQGRARDTGTPELISAFGAGCAMLLAELDQHDHDLAARLGSTVQGLVDSVPGDGQPEFSADIRLEREEVCT